MKPYEKPKLIALSLAGNSVLCSSCTIDAKGANMDESFRRALGIAGWLDASGTEAVSGVFTTEDPCGLEVLGYCKFVPNGRIVINS